LLEETEVPRVKAALYGLWIEPSRMVEENAKRRGLLVRDVMTKKVITFSPDTPVIEVAQTMHSRRIGRVPILEDGRVVGIIARSDVMRAIAEGKTLSE
jgi:CBS domain-containing protein